MNFNFIYLMLFPPVFFSREFLPEWFIWFIASHIFLLTLLKLPKLIAYLTPLLGYFVLKTVGFQIIPETTIPILAILLLSQMTIDRVQDKFTPYLGFLWFGIFSLFSVNLYYIVYSTITFILFFISENRVSGDSFLKSFKTVLKYKKQLAATFLLALFLFVFFPRFNSFLPSANNRAKGRVGYSLDIDNTTTSDLALSSNTAFYAELSRRVPLELLYWRGRVHSYTDGYNWRTVSAPAARGIREREALSDTITSIVKYEQSFGNDIIILDSPIRIENSNSRIYSVKSTNEKKLYTAKKKIIFTAKSSLSKTTLRRELSTSEKKTYLQLPSFTPKALREIDKDFKGLDSAEKIISKFRDFIILNEFGYTLSPGPMPSMSIFLERKLGYCTHFASLLGVVLRLNKIPARLISGFQGGIYNEVGDYYEIKSNDAHAWVEYFSDGTWKRVDPTAFISPDRIQLGGENFFTASAQERENISLGKFPFFYKFKQYVDNLDYKVSLFFDNYNKDQQKNLSSKLGLTLKKFLLLGAILITLTLGLLYYFLRRKPVKKRHPIDKYLINLDKKLKNKKTCLLEQRTIKSMLELIEKSNYEANIKERANLIINEYQKLRYSRSNADESKIIELLKNLYS